MSLLDLMVTVGRAKAGTRMLVVEPIDAVNAAAGGILHLPHGTKLEVMLGTGGSLTAAADMGDRIARVYLFAEDYAKLAIE